METISQEETWTHQLMWVVHQKLVEHRHIMSAPLIITSYKETPPSFIKE
jgi:hypothetical protein